MSYFKKFCDLIGGIGAFFATVYLLGRYMEYNPADAESKLKVFFSTENAKEYRHYLIFIALLFGAVLLGRLLKRFPAITLPLSVLPLCQVMSMLWGKRLYSKPEFYVIVCLVVVVGNIYEAYSADRERGGNQLYIASVLTCGLGVLGTLASMKFSKMALDFSERFLESELSEAESLLEEKLSLVGVDLISNVPEGELQALTFIAASLLACLALAVFSRKLKPLKVLCMLASTVPFIYAVSSLHTEKLATSPMLLLVPTAVFFFCTLSAAVVKKSR